MSAFPQNSSIVLVHGAWADGSCWSNVILPLQRRGLNVICAPIPLTPLANDTAALNQTLERNAGSVGLPGAPYSVGLVHGGNTKTPKQPGLRAAADSVPWDNRAKD